MISQRIQGRLCKYHMKGINLVGGVRGGGSGTHLANGLQRQQWHGLLRLDACDPQKQEGGSKRSEVKVSQLCLTLGDPMDLQPARLLCPWNSPGQNTGVGTRSFLQGIFPTQGLNPGLPHCRQILNHLRHQGRPERGSGGREWVVDGKQTLTKVWGKARMGSVWGGVWLGQSASWVLVGWGMLWALWVPGRVDCIHLGHGTISEKISDLG